jgi:hypothetical protein
MSFPQCFERESRGGVFFNLLYRFNFGGSILEMIENILLFFGSGISFASSLPSVEKITDSILNEVWHKNSDQHFSKGPHPSPHLSKKDITPRIQEFLIVIQSYSDRFIINGRGNKTTYEDLFFICKQILDGEKAIEIICGKAYRLSMSQKESVLNSMNLMSCAVRDLLGVEYEPVGLEIINELIKLENNLDIVTLNHDLLIERLFEINRIRVNVDFVDGFGDQDGDVRWFEPKRYEDNSKKIQIYKLHGSINWYNFRMVRTSEDKVGISLRRDKDHCMTSNGDELICPNVAAIFLMGTYKNYESELIKTILTKFEERLKHHHFVVMSGYGWKDSKINETFYKWISSNSKRRLLLLYKNFTDPRNAFGEMYDKYVQSGQIIQINKWLSESSLEMDLTQYLN